MYCFSYLSVHIYSIYGQRHRWAEAKQKKIKKCEITCCLKLKAAPGFLLSAWLPAAGIAAALPLSLAAWSKLGPQDGVMEFNGHNSSITVSTHSISKLQQWSHSETPVAGAGVCGLVLGSHQTSVHDCVETGSAACGARCLSLIPFATLAAVNVYFLINLVINLQINLKKMNVFVNKMERKLQLPFIPHAHTQSSYLSSSPLTTDCIVCIKNLWLLLIKMLIVWVQDNDDNIDFDHRLSY